jgi:glutathione synthase/RimK-type ligase-like ATP-grasp enzyme
LILIISSQSDDHARAVLADLAQIGVDAALFDLSSFPNLTHLTMFYEKSKRDFNILMPDQVKLHLEDCKVIWWRRPQQFIFHSDITKDSYYRFAYNESYEAFSGLWQALDAFWINHPTLNEVASHKTYHLHVAQKVGFNIPTTLITNDPEQARSFIAAQGYDRTIYKSFLATEEEWRETRLLKREELDLIDSVCYAPVIFQEYIPAKVDLRITIVGEEIFAAAIHSQKTDYKVDYRMEMSNTLIEPFQLPEDIKQKLRKYMEVLGLVYGAIDMRLTPENHYVFLEINPGGQWLFIEERTKQPITSSFANLLAKYHQKT